MMTIFEAAEKAVEEMSARTALHEAGHVLAAHLLGHRVASVYSLTGDGAAYHGEGVFPDAAVLAGGTAERMAGYPNPLAGSKPDLLRAAAWDEQRQNAAIERATTLLNDNRQALVALARIIRTEGRLGGHEVRVAVEVALEHQHTRSTNMDEFEYTEEEALIDVQRAHRIKAGILATHPGIPEERAWQTALHLAADGRFVDGETVSRALGETAVRGEIRYMPPPRLVERR